MAQSQNYEDMRAHKRLRERVRVEFKLVGSSDMIKNMEFRDARTRDISAGGVFIELGDTHLTAQKQSVVDDFLLFKSQIQLKIHLPTRQDPVNAMGKAVWIEKEVPGREYRHGIAISFTEIDPGDRAFMDEFVLSRV